MSHLDGLPELPRGWYWLRYDARTHLVLLRCVHGMWCWCSPDMAALREPTVLEAFHRGLEQAVLDGVRGEITITGGYNDLPTSPEDDTVRRLYWFDVVEAPPVHARRWVDLDRGQRHLVSA